MPSSGPNSPGTLVDDAAVGTVAWTNPTNAAASDNTRASASNLAGATTHYLKATNFGFSISGTIDGVTVEIERLWNASGISPRDVTVKLVVGGAVSGDNKADTAVDWPTSDTYKTYGGSADLWGLSLLASDVNATNFGVVISATSGGAAATLSIDHIRITVDYTASAKSLPRFRRATRFWKSR